MLLGKIKTDSYQIGPIHLPSRGSILDQFKQRQRGVATGRIYKQIRSLARVIFILWKDLFAPSRCDLALVKNLLHISSYT